MSIFIDFPCNGGAVLGEGQTYEDVMDDHYATCRLCPDQRTEHEKQLDNLHQKNWEARVDAALNEARKVTP